MFKILLAKNIVFHLWKSEIRRISFTKNFPTAKDSIKNATIAQKNAKSSTKMQIIPINNWKLMCFF